MYTHGDKTPDKQNSKKNVQLKTTESAAFSYQDNRPETAQLKKLQQMANNSAGVKQLQRIQQMANQSPQVQKVAQLQQQANKTGMPDSLKSGIENLSGYSMDDVKVHYNSNKPAQLNAHAYAQGTDIHLGAGQEKHLPHEAWHVVQQKQGRVKPTRQLKGKVNINDDSGLEKEADIMGGKAVQLMSNKNQGGLKSSIFSETQPIQKKGSVNTTNISNQTVQLGGITFSRGGVDYSLEEELAREQDPPSIKIESNGVLKLTVPTKRTGDDRVLDFSLARHWFPKLSSEGKDKNSVMYDSLKEADIESDCMYIGMKLQRLWRESIEEPEEYMVNTPSGRKYRVDREGSSSVLNHFFVISGTNVVNVSADVYRFIREIKLIKDGKKKTGQALAYWKIIKKEWMKQIPLMDKITGYSITDIKGVLSFAEEQRAELDIGLQVRFKSDIDRFMKANNTDHVPSSFLSEESWALVSDMDFKAASKAYKSLLKKHKLHFADNADTTFGNSKLTGVDDV